MARGGQPKSLRALIAGGQRPMIILARFFLFRFFHRLEKNENEEIEKSKY